MENIKKNIDGRTFILGEITSTNLIYMPEDEKEREIFLAEVFANPADASARGIISAMLVEPKDSTKENHGVSIVDYKLTQDGYCTTPTQKRFNAAPHGFAERANNFYNSISHKADSRRLKEEYQAAKKNWEAAKKLFDECDDGDAQAQARTLKEIFFMKMEEKKEAFNSHAELFGFEKIA